jgi:hypothetical protein
MDIVPDSQAFSLGYMNEPYRLKLQRHTLSVNCAKAGHALGKGGRGARS